jgi:hypothetical protein
MLAAAAAVLLQAGCAGDPTPIDSRGAMAPVAAVAAVSDESPRLGELGTRFDLRKFHSATLIDGPLPLDGLEAKVDRWIAAEKEG